MIRVEAAAGRGDLAANLFGVRLLVIRMIANR
jgi:hypothetical protein